MKFKRRYFACASAGWLLAASGAAQRPLTVDDPTMGITPVPAALNTWQARSIDLPTKPTDADFKILAEDFFTLEYGEPLRSFAFTNGYERMWGSSKNHPDRPGIRFALGWGAFVMCPWAVIADVEQDAESSEWDLYDYSGKYVHKKRLVLKTPGGKRTTCFIPMGMIRMPSGIIGFKLVCADTNCVAGTVRSLRFVPYGIPVAYRRTLTLKEKPSFAAVSFPQRPHSKVVVNGRTVAEGVVVRGGGATRHVELTEALKVGTNEVVFAFDGGAGWGVSTSTALEFFTVSDDGTTTLYPTDASWQGRLGEGPWTKVSVGARVGQYGMANGVQIATGTPPLHAGPLQVRPKGLPFPVFDYDREIAYEIRAPKGLAGAEAVVRAVRADGSAATGRAVLGASGTATVAFAPKTFETGAYALEWTLTKGGRAVDAATGEMLVCGPLGLKEYPLEEMEAEVARRKRLLCTIDPCDPRWADVSSNFIAHTGMFVKDRVALGRTVTELGRTMRETDPSDGGYFAWHIPVGTLGNAHMVEIDYPDTREQVIYSAVEENYPYPFCNNGAPYGGGHPNATGSAKTGGREPLSGKLRTLRYVFFPGSRNATVSFESGLTGKPACCAQIRVYELPEGLPAWKLPKTDRIFMNHTERTLFGIWGASVTPVIYSTATQPSAEPRICAGAFAAIRNRISQLKYEGQNAAIEGVYMYMGFYPTLSGESNVPQESFDFTYAIAKMYRHNGIKFFAGFEYLASPKLSRLGAYDVSERDMWAGKGVSPAHHVDRHGRITIGFGGMGLNYRNEIVRSSITNLLTDIYRRYDGLDVAGLWVISGGWWIPGLTVADNRLPDEIGYDDASIADFERATGLSLGTDVTGGARFARRYELLTGKYALAWQRWRSLELRKAFEDLQRIVKSGRDPWQLYASVSMRLPSDHPFRALTSTPYQRDDLIRRTMSETCADPALYGAKSDTDVRLVPSPAYSADRDFARYGTLMNAGTRALYRRNDALYFQPVGLNERYNRTDGIGNRPWWWTRTNATVYEVADSGEAAYDDLVDVVSDYTPQLIAHTWLDCNLVTAHAEALRAFLSGYYATPLGEGAPYGGVTGVTARLYGGKLQLVNNTPYPVFGERTIRPYGIVVLDAARPKAFRFDAAVERQVLAELDAVLANEAVVSRIRAEYVTRLRAAKRAKDAYTACVLLRDWEVLNVTRRWAASSPALEQQARAEKMLAEEGAVRINCGCREDLRDEAGRLWLRDQAYTGFGAYGGEFTVFVDRGPIPITGTATPLPYRTEAGGERGGPIAYHVPVPDGAYTVRLHFAETWDKLPGREMDVCVGGAVRHVVPWDAGGRYAASVVAWPGVRPAEDGMIHLAVIKGAAILNGIEILREGK